MKNVAAMALHGPTVVLEMRGQAPEENKYVDKKSGQQATMRRNVISAEVLGTAKPIRIEVFAERGSDKFPEPLPYKRGETFTAVLSGYEADFKGQTGKMTLTPGSHAPYVPVK